jgi:hypothetical protein
VPFAEVLPAGAAVLFAAVPFAVGEVLLLAVPLAAGLAVPLEVATSAGGGGAPAALKKRVKLSIYIMFIMNIKRG